MKALLCAAALTACAFAQAHTGHGMAGQHWHATDAWGFALLGAVVVATLWFNRGK